MTQIPVKYVGEHAVTLVGRVYKNADGSRRETNALFPGDVILMEDREVIGFSQKIEANGATVDLGVGTVVKPEHASLTPQELYAAGYLFHQGRLDFTPVNASPSEVPASSDVQPVSLVEAEPMEEGT